MAGEDSENYIGCSCDEQKVEIRKFELSDGDSYTMNLCRTCCSKPVYTKIKYEVIK